MKEGMPGPWAREYECGCRDVLGEGVRTGAGDRCPTHDRKVVVIGYLTPESVTWDLLEAAERAEGVLADMVRDAGEDHVLSELHKAIAMARGTAA